MMLTKYLAKELELTHNIKTVLKHSYILDSLSQWTILKVYITF